MWNKMCMKTMMIFLGEKSKTVDLLLRIAEKGRTSNHTCTESFIVKKV